MPLAKSRLKELRELGKKKVREVRGVFVVEGARVLKEALGSSFEILAVYYTADAMADPGIHALLEEAGKRTPDLHEVSPREMEIISDTVEAPGVFAVMRQERPRALDLLRPGGEDSILVGLDAVADPGNLGSVIRSADWFGASGLVLGKGSVEVYNPKVVRSTMGSIFHLPVAFDADLMSLLVLAKRMGYFLYVADAEGDTSFDRVTFERKSIIVFGNEAWGVSEPVHALADVRVGIQRYGLAESLNVGVACGIILSGLHREGG